MVARRSVHAVACALLGIVLASLSQDPDHTSEPDTAPFPRQGRYAGKPKCVSCHRSEARAIERAVHAPVVGSEAVMGCETCHGPGDAHATDPDNDVELITYPPALSAASQARLCGRCHAPEVRGHGGDPAGFLAAGRGCTECHSVHETPDEHGSVAFKTRLACDAVAEAVGGAKCASCHPLKDAELARSAHASLAVDGGTGSCESCHGAGSQHVDSSGIARFITRPDTAHDGVETCTTCHADVDPERFHWPSGEHPLLSRGMRCTTCHTVHTPRSSGDEIATNRICATCHAPAFAVLEDSVHATLGRLDTPLEVGCGACHEGAEDHARRGGRPELVASLRDSTAAEQTRICATCHDRDHALHGFATSIHARSEVGCLACHSPAEPHGATLTNATAKCSECHADAAAEFRLPNHHPVALDGRHGSMTCVDCHDAHATTHRVRDLERRERRCVECHREYRGPFTFAHQASRRDGCLACHLAHGSSNRRMLRASTPQQLCIACHADFPAFHDQTQGAVFTNCIACHTEVHGSNHSRFLFR